MKHLVVNKDTSIRTWAIICVFFAQSWCIDSELTPFQQVSSLQKHLKQTMPFLHIYDVMYFYKFFKAHLSTWITSLSRFRVVQYVLWPHYLWYMMKTNDYIHFHKIIFYNIQQSHILISNLSLYEKHSSNNIQSTMIIEI